MVCPLFVGLVGGGFVGRHDETFGYTRIDHQEYDCDNSAIDFVEGDHFDILAFGSKLSIAAYLNRLDRAVQHSFHLFDADAVHIDFVQCMLCPDA